MPAPVNRPPPRRQRRYAALCLAAALALNAAPARSATPTEYEIKAAFIRHFTQYVEWPAQAERTRLRLCILGKEPFGAALDVFRAHQGKEPGLDVAQIEPNADLRGCQMLFVAASAEKYLGRVVAQAVGAGMLTIADSEGFGQRGIMINFVTENNRVYFEINLNAILGSGLEVSSKLLSLGRKPAAE
ncbi:MAG: YfiR family protein [Sulfuricellaceae bacterium]|nr:YfiR family protein [Sulfuricellaceae bacterium]